MVVIHINTNELTGAHSLSLLGKNGAIWLVDKMDGTTGLKHGAIWLVDEMTQNSGHRRVGVGGEEEARGHGLTGPLDKDLGLRGWILQVRPDLDGAQRLRLLRRLLQLPSEVIEEGNCLR